MASAARAIAQRVLCDLDRRGSTLAERMAQADAASLPERERSFLHELVFGTLRRRGAIDAALTSVLDRPLARVGPELRAILRIAAHQLLHLRVPARAAVHEAVALTRQSAPHAAGFANAVLRRLAREGPPAEPNPDLEPLLWLTQTGSLPDWLAERWLDRFGKEQAIARARAALEEPPVVFRVNPRARDEWPRLQASLDPVPCATPGAWVAMSGRPHEHHERGSIYIQDEAAQRVARLTCGPGRTLDACAAPGGKAFLIADQLADRELPGWVVAVEASARRFASLATLARRWRAPRLELLRGDALRPPFAASRFEQVLLDAPCSGLGTIARHPDIRWRARPAELRGHAERQLALLQALAPLVAPGGRLVYATCSSEPEENGDVVATFLSRSPSYRREVLTDPLDRGLSEAESGFFAALLRRGA